MKHILSFSLLVFIPLVAIHIYQRQNMDYLAFKKNHFNYVGIFLAIGLFIFIFFAENLAPNFVIRYETGWSSRRSNEYIYTAYWLGGFVLAIFPHVCKRSSWPLFHTAMQAQSKYDTKWYQISGFALIGLLVYQTVELSS